MKTIQLTKDMKTKALEEYVKYLNSMKYLDKEKIDFSISFTKTIANKPNKPTIAITSEAWIKIQQLILNTSDEIGWHGTVIKDKDLYTIEEIYVYPQTVSAARVTTDDEEYAKWTMQLSNEEINNMRFQGHSHVNMGVTPSGTDENYYNSLLQNLSKDDFYIFMIINKDLKINIMLYDLQNNIIFEKEDITFVIGSPVNLTEWAEEQKEMFLKKQSTNTGNASDFYNKMLTDRINAEEYYYNHAGSIYNSHGEEITRTKKEKPQDLEKYFKQKYKKKGAKKNGLK